MKNESTPSTVGENANQTVEAVEQTMAKRKS